MKNIINFRKKNFKEIFLLLEEKKERRILNFLNNHDLYQIKTNQRFQECVSKDYTLNMPDGFFVSFYLSLINLRKVSRIRGPFFTRKFFENKNLLLKNKHFFIGLEKQEFKKIKEKYEIPNKNIKYYNPPYIKTNEFPKTEILKIVEKINNFNPDFVWVGIGCPKQNLLSESLFHLTKSKYFLNVGAAIDFLTNKKKEAPTLFQKLGIEWLYRLLTDFNYSKKKVYRSFIGLWSLGRIR